MRNALLETRDPMTPRLFIARAVRRASLVAAMALLAGCAANAAQNQCVGPTDFCQPFFG
jgi:hypothetical protein